MNKFKTSQENFWSGEFGDEYAKRPQNNGQKLIASNSASFARMLNRTNNISSIIEFGANIGTNLIGIRNVFPEIKLSAIEINEKAANELKEIKILEDIFHKSILDFNEKKKWDLTFTRGVLIHINPDELKNVYQKLYEHSNRYILISEYYNPAPVAIDYRGHKEKLFKRDFAGDIMEMYNDLKLIDYGFEYHKDSNFFFDDLNWFLLEKT